MLQHLYDDTILLQGCSQSSGLIVSVGQLMMRLAKQSSRMSTGVVRSGRQRHCQFENGVLPLTLTKEVPARQIALC